MPDIPDTLAELERLEKAATRGPWDTNVLAVALGLETTAYAHQVVIGDRAYTVGHRDCQNFERIDERPATPDENKRLEGYGDGGPTVVQTGVGRLPHDTSPLPNAALIAATRNALPLLLAMAREAMAWRAAMARGAIYTAGHGDWPNDDERPDMIADVTAARAATDALAGANAREAT
jgi:hypothetical protein